MGRPSKYTPELAELICDRIAAGKTLVSICRPTSMPHRNTVYGWLVADEVFSGMYARAKERQADALIDEAMARARRSSRETAAADRLLVDTLKWAAAKFKPHAYGDKVQVEQSGGQTVRVVVEYADADDPPPSQ